MALPKIPRINSVAEAREALARFTERRRIPQRLNVVIPRKGTSHAKIARLCKRFWDYHDWLFPRQCRYCMHFDYVHGQESIHGKQAADEADIANVTAQRHLIEDYTWDVDGRDVQIAVEDLGGCDVHNSYVIRQGTCPHFERTAGGALVPPEQRVETEPEDIKGWKPPVDPTSKAQEDIEIPAAVAYPEDLDDYPDYGGEGVQGGTDSEQTH